MAHRYIAILTTVLCFSIYKTKAATSQASGPVNVNNNKETLREQCESGMFLHDMMHTCRSCDRFCPDEEYNPKKCGLVCRDYFTIKKLNREMSKQMRIAQDHIEQKEFTIKNLQSSNTRLMSAVIVLACLLGLVLLSIVLYFPIKQEMKQQRKDKNVTAVIGDVEAGTNPAYAENAGNETRNAEPFNACEATGIEVEEEADDGVAAGNQALLQ